jgi:hypothetical protein
MASERTFEPTNGGGGIVPETSAITLGWALFFSMKEHTMTARSAGNRLWQQNLASLIRSGLFSKAATGAANGLFTVVGVYKDETCSAPLAKYSDLKQAAEATNLVNRIAREQGPGESI